MNKKIILIILVVLIAHLFFLNSGNTEAQLANSSWPTFHGNAQRTGLSPYDTSHVDGTILWAFKAGDQIEASPMVGEDGAIYFGANDGYFYAVNKNGTLRWKTKISTPRLQGYGGDTSYTSIIAAAVIDKQGNIYVTSRDQNLTALDSEGKIKWKFPINLSPDHIGSPLVGDDGTIYVNASPPDENFYEDDGTIYIKENPPEGGLYAINPDGTEKWHYYVKQRMFNSPAMGKDGTLYIAVATSFSEVKLIAINQDGTKKWEVLLPKEVESSPVVADNGVIYIGSFTQDRKGAGLFAVTKEGVLWHYTVGEKEVMSTPAVAKDGTIYIGSMVDKLFAINPDGTKKWSFDVGGEIGSSPAIGADGTIYFGVAVRSADQPNFIALNPDGTMKWKFASKLHVTLIASPAIGSEGTVYMTGWDGNLYAFGGSSPSAASIPEGALIRAIGGIDVYIVKHVGSKKFKRLILSPHVFNSYGHLRWEDIMDVQQSVVDAFTTSDMVRATVAGDPKVYRLFPSGDTGTKRWVETAEAFNRFGYDWDAIYTINKTERDAYLEGAPIE